MPKLAFIHTVPGLVDRFRTLAGATLAGWSSYAVVDESLLLDTIERGALSPKTVQRLAGYIFCAADAGADAIVVTCSTLGGAVDAIRPITPVPLFRIDRGMAETAVGRARRIGVLATLPTTLKPTAALLSEAAAKAGAQCDISEHLCEGAFANLRAGDRAGHDASVRGGFSALAAHVDLVVLAQASMADALDGEHAAIPYLTSPDIGMADIARRLRAA
jgi:Asp/Glu/hydantoin racemase